MLASACLAVLHAIYKAAFSVCQTFAYMNVLRLTPADICAWISAHHPEGRQRWRGF